MGTGAWRAGIIGVVAALALAACGAPPAPAPPDDASLFRDAVRQRGAGEQFYFVMTDRFANGEEGNDAGGLVGDRLSTGFDPTDKGFYHGGDLTGVRERLDYIAGLGTTAIWLTPSFANKPVQGSGSDASAGYHGYWTTDFTRIDPHLGTNADMAALIEAAHARGIKVYFDIITNHTADVIAYEGGATAYVSKEQRPYRDAAGASFDDATIAASGRWPTLDAATFAPYRPAFRTPADATAKTPAWLNDPTMYHNRGDSTWVGESNTYGDFQGLDDLFTERPEVVKGFIDLYATWVDLGIDGFRIDTVKHVDLPFWQQFGPAISTHAEGVPSTLRRPGSSGREFFMFGEVYSTDPGETSLYSTKGRLPATLDFTFQDKAVAWAKGGPAGDFLALLDGDDLASDADSSALSQPTFLGNHDMGRVGNFLSVVSSGDELLGRLRVAHALQFLTRGQPVVYYGDEQGFRGFGGDKDARQDMFATQVASYAGEPVVGAASGSRDRYDPSHPLYQHIAALARLRSQHPALVAGSMTGAQASDGLLTFTRWLPGEADEYVVVLNNTAHQVDGTLTLPGANRALTPVFGSDHTLTQDAAGAVRAGLPAFGVQVYRTPKAGLAGGDVTLVAPEGGVLVDRAPLRAVWDGATNGQVSFAVREVGPGVGWQHLGTDDNAPWTVYPDLTAYEKGTRLEVRATAKASDGTLKGASITVTVG